MTPDEKVARIRALNDKLRKTGKGGEVVAVGAFAQADELEKIVAGTLLQAYDKFDAGDDPHQEHDFGTFKALTKEFIWKIDYYDLNLDGHSADPSNPDVTKRVLSIFYAEDY